MAYALAPRATPRRAPPRLYDASPRNALIVPFLHRAFPDATFVYVHRRPLDALAESLAMWRAGNAATYPELPGWSGPRWSFLLVPGWADLIGLPLAEVVTEQWARTMRTLIADLEALPPQRWCVTDRDALLANPGAELRRLLGFLGLRSATAAAALVEPELSELDAVTVDAARAELGPYIARAAGLVEHARDWSAAPGS
jgi:hypothetical protein